MTHQVIMAGFGGQGVMSMGQVLAYAGMLEGKRVSWMPSYGPEMRGGTANCGVIVSAGPIGSPVVTEPNGLIIMNKPSLLKFEGALQRGGVLVYNSSLIDSVPQRQDIRVIAVRANAIAGELGNTRIANMVALGAFLGATRAVAVGSVVESLRKALPAHRHHLIPVNEQALQKGLELA
ncbi:MAG: 2-oxoacid:acceptor oxidoreductase family protein [Bacillota bacterium]